MMDKLTAPVPFPDHTIWSGITDSQLSTFATVNSDILDQYLALSQPDFQSSIPDLESFLKSYLLVHSNALARKRPLALLPPSTPDDGRLKEAVFLVIHRILAESDLVAPFTYSADFLAQACLCFSWAPSLSGICEAVWNKRRDDIEANLSQSVSLLVKSMGKADERKLLHSIGSLASLLMASSDAGKIVLSGPDFLDALIRFFPNMGPELQYACLLLVHHGLLGLIAPPSRQFSILADQLYVFKSKTSLANPEERNKSLLVELISHMSILDDLDLDDPKASRARRALEELAQYRIEPAEDTAPEWDGFQATPATEPTVSAEIQEKIAQLLDLFPDFGPGFLQKLLEAYQGDVEQSTAALLDENLPPHIAELDRHLPLEEPTPVVRDSGPGKPSTVIFSSTSHPPQDDFPRKHTNEAFGDLGRASRIIHKGGIKSSELVDPVLADDDDLLKANKTAVLSRIRQLALDDEYDDTYDYSDYTTAQAQGGAAEEVEDSDAARPTSSSGPAHSHRKSANPKEMPIYLAWKSNPATFARTRDARNGKARQALRASTNWSNDRLEDWAILIVRDPEKQRQFELLATDPSRLGGGKNKGIERTAWRGGDNDDSDDRFLDSGTNDVPDRRYGPRPDAKDGQPGSSRGGGGGGRGGGRGRGGSSGRGSRANHSRRDAYARKMARGG